MMLMGRRSDALVLGAYYGLANSWRIFGLLLALGFMGYEAFLR